MPHPVDRRGFLGLAVSAAALAAVGGCTADAPDPRVSQERRRRRRAARQSLALRAAYDQAIEAFPHDLGQLAPLAAAHDEHARALAGRRSWSLRPEPATRSWATAAEARGALAGLERAAQRRRTRWAVNEPDRRLAGLLASVSACHAVHAALLEGRVRVPADVPDVREPAVLADLLQAEHAVVYGYGVAGAVLRGTDRQAAVRGWDRHRAARDEFERRLVAAGSAVPQAPAAYDLPFTVTDKASARRLLVVLEEGLAAHWRAAVQQVRPRGRTGPVQGLTRSALAAAQWRGGSVPFPGR